MRLSSISSISFRNLKFLAVVLLFPLLPACTIVPGMHYSSSAPQPGVEPILKEITPQLLQQEREDRAKYDDSQVSALFAQPQPYKVGIGDVLTVNLIGDTVTPTVSVTMMPVPNSAADSLVPFGYAVDQDGEIHLPYVGAVKVAGLTIRDVYNELDQQFSKYIKKPEFTAQISSYRSKRVYIAGEVKSPGVLPVIDIPMTLPEALGRVGGYTAMGNAGAVEINRDGKRYVVDIPEMTAHGLNPSRILLKDGDMVRVPSREESKVFVIGDVTKPAAVMPLNDRLSLNEALGEAGGVNPYTGDPRQIFVIRNVSDKHPEVFHLDAASPVALALAEDFELQAKDVVYVDAAPLVRWNRVISLILPNAQLVVDAKYLNVLH
jgi:polysaccharide biosynthesis/export protein